MMIDLSFYIYLQEISSRLVSSSENDASFAIRYGSVLHSDN